MKRIREVIKKIKSARDFLINFIHGLFAFSLLGFTFYVIMFHGAKTSSDSKTGLSSVGVNEILTFIGALAFILIGIVGVYEYAYSNGISFLVPPMFVNHKENTYLREADRMMEIYYKKDIKFIREYEKERTVFFCRRLD